MAITRQQISQRRRNRLGMALGALLILNPSSALAESKSMLTQKTEEFLADRSSVGAIVGSVLAGASFAHPFASVGGTIVGFFIGKSTDFSDREKTDGASYARSSFVPATLDGSVSQLALSGSFAQPDLATTDTLDDDADIVATPLQPEEDSLSTTPAPDKTASAETDLAGSDQVLLASASDTLPVSVATGTAQKPAEAPAEVPPRSTDPLVEPDEPDFEPVHLVITREVGGTQSKLDELTATIRREQKQTEFVPHAQCPSGNAPRYRKRIAVAGFSVESPQQGSLGGIYEAGESVTELLYQKFRETGQVQPFMAPGRQMFASLDMAPTRFAQANRLSKYSGVSREMGVQFVVSGVIRDIDVHDESAWDTSAYSNVKRALFSADTSRAFVVDVIVHDGFTGQVVMEERFSTVGRWDLSRTEKVAFGDSRFLGTGYGQAVEQALNDISEKVIYRLACQPMLVPILQVDGKDLLLDVGTDSGLLPGTRMSVLRSESSLARPDAPPQLWDTGVELHIHSLSLDTSRAWMPQYGGVINIRAGDYAVVY